MNLKKALFYFHVLGIVAYLILYLFPESLGFDSRGWSHYLMAFLFGTFIVSVIKELSDRKSKADSTKKDR